MYLNRLTTRSRYFGGCNIKLDSTCRVFLLHREQNFCNFCCKLPKIKFCIEEVSIGEIYNTLLDSNEGDLSTHKSQTIYVSKTNENKITNEEAPVEEVVEFESGTEPLWIIFINIRRRSVLSSWFWPLWNASWRTNWNLSASTSVELQALCAVCNRHFKRVPLRIGIEGSGVTIIPKNWKD